MATRKRLGQIDLFTKRVSAKAYRRSGTEFALGCMVADTLRRFASPGWRWTHFPAGELRAGSAGSRLQRMGLQPGWPDLQLLAPAAGGIRFLELKRETAGRLSDDQRAFQEFCILNGYVWALATNLSEAVAALQAWGALRSGVHVDR